jgi:hypothetical protein
LKLRIESTIAQLETGLTTASITCNLVHILNSFKHDHTKFISFSTEPNLYPNLCLQNCSTPALHNTMTSGNPLLLYSFKASSTLQSSRRLLCITGLTLLINGLQVSSNVINKHSATPNRSPSYRFKFNPKPVRTFSLNKKTLCSSD